MTADMKQIDKKINELETQMLEVDFWSDKNKAGSIKRINRIKREKGGCG